MPSADFSAKIDTNVEAKVSSDLESRIKNNNWKVDKGDFETYGEAGGAIAASAACAATGAGVVITPLCGAIGGAVGKFLAGALYSIADALWGPSDEEIAAEERKARTEEFFAKEAFVQQITSEAQKIFEDIVERIRKTAKKHGLELTRQDIKTQMAIEGLSLHSPGWYYVDKVGNAVDPQKVPGAKKLPRELAPPDWAIKFYKKVEPAVIQKEVLAWLKQLQISATKAGIKIAANAAGKEAQKVFNDKLKIQQEQKDRAYKKKVDTEVAKAGGKKLSVKAKVGIGGLVIGILYIIKKVLFR